jgi:RNA polymerase sigma-70 factor (ECF subfamily)
MLTEPRPNPEDLLCEALAGRHESLGRLLQLYTNYLSLLASSQLGRRLQTRCSPSDVVQETFCEAHRDFAQFHGETESEFLAWLRQILVNNIARVVEKHLVAAKRDVRREVSINEISRGLGRSTARLESVLADHGPSPSASAHRREYAVLLADRLAELPPDYRDVLVQRHLEGLPFSEIAGRMGRSSGAVRMLWLRAIDQLRELLHSEEST